MLEKTKHPFDLMGERWPSTVLARKQVPEFTGGLISVGHMANLDCRGEGPQERIKIGRNSGYVVSSYVEWLKSRCEVFGPGAAAA